MELNGIISQIAINKKSHYIGNATIKFIAKLP